MSSHQKVAVIETEKSPKVLSSVWKEHVLLEKDLRVLQRSEHTVVSRITVDQKILHRRFQKKLHRARITAARSAGNKDLERELRDRSIGVLNTDVGRMNIGKGAEAEVLEKVWARGRAQIEHFLGRPAEEEEEDSRSRSMSSPGSRSVHCPVVHISRPSTSASQRGTKQKGKIRPLTASPTKLQQRSANSRPKTVLGTTTKGDPDDLGTGQAGSLSPKEDKSFLNTLTQFLSPVDGSSRPVSESSRSIQVPQRPSRQKLSLASTFGSQATEITLLDIQKKRNKEAQYDSKVKDFITRINPLTSKKYGGGGSDYYATKMWAHNIRESQIPGTPETEAVRRINNQDIRNLTVPPLDMDFDKRPTTFIDVTAF